MPDAPDDNRWGTVFMGPTPDRESTIDKVTEDRHRELWNRRTEAEYMERVRAKAALRVQAMLDEARARAEAIRGTARQWAEKLKTECEGLYAQAEKARQEADALRAEAETLRESAREEGYRIGVEQAFMELDEHRTALDEATASVLKTIESQSGVLFEAWRRDLADLLREAVEISTGWVLTEERTAVLEALLDASVQELADRRHILIKVNPQDCDAVTLVIESAKTRFPDLKSWEVRPDDGVEAAGLMVESASGVVDNRQDARRQVVADVLRHLTLPPGPADAGAEAAVAAELERTGMNALAAEAEARAAQSAAKAPPDNEAPIEETAAPPLPGGEGGAALSPAALPDVSPADPPDAGAGAGSDFPEVAAEPILPDSVEDFPELEGVELPPDLPAAPAAASLPDAPARDLFPTSPEPGPGSDPEPASGTAPGPARADAEPGADAALAEDEDIPILNITVGEPDPEAVQAAQAAAAAALAEAGTDRAPEAGDGAAAPERPEGRHEP